MTNWARTYDAMVNEKWMPPWGMVRCLTVRRRNGGDRIGWDTLQAIKNELLGPDAVAVEVYPAASDVVNEANLRHLWECAPGTVPNLNRRLDRGHRLQFRPSAGAVRRP